MFKHLNSIKHLIDNNLTVHGTCLCGKMKKSVNSSLIIVVSIDDLLATFRMDNNDCKFSCSLLRDPSVTVPESKCSESPIPPMYYNFFF